MSLLRIFCMHNIIGPQIKLNHMDIVFSESKFVYLRASRSPENQDRTDIVAEGMRDGTYSDTREAQKVMLEQSKLRSRLSGSEIFTDEDKKQWEKRLQDAERQAISADDMKKMAQEFDKQQSDIKNAVTQYTDKVMSNKEDAFTIDTSRGLDTAKDYVEWFAGQSFDKKMEALKEIDDDIRERKTLRKKLLGKLDKKEVTKLRRSEMQEKVKELEKMEANVKTYSNLISQNERLFHNPEQYIKEFEDLTLNEQQNWIQTFNEKILKPRLVLVQIYDKLPKDHRNDGEFFKAGMKEKQVWLEKLSAKIEQDYIKDVNETPTDIMSQNSKRFAIVDFLGLKTVYEKAMWLDQLSKSKKAEEKLTLEYSQKRFNEVRKLDAYSERNWEKLRFEEKQELLKSMKVEAALMDTFGKILDEAAKDKVISQKTKGLYDKIYNEANLNGRKQITQNILFAMRTRRNLMDDFEKLSPETQKQFNEFYNLSHTKRLHMYNKAKKYENEQNADEPQEEKDKKKEKEMPKSLEANDIQEIINELQGEADSFETEGELERALDKHQSVLKLHPDNKLSLKKQKELLLEIETLDSLTGDEIEDALQRESKSNYMSEELSNIELSQEILEDRENVVRHNLGIDNLGKQTSHLTDDSFDREVHKKVFEQSEGKQTLDENGKIQNVRKIDLSLIGVRNKGNVTQLRQDLKNLGTDENISDIQLVDDAQGRDLSINEAKRKMAQRRHNAAKELAKRTENVSSAAEADVINAAEDIVEDEIEKQAISG